MTDSWKVTLPCTRAEAEGLREDISPLALLDVPPVLMTSEADSSQPDAWRLDAYFGEPPSPAMLAHLAALVPSAAGAPPPPRPGAGGGGPPPHRRAGRGPRLGDDQPGGARADPGRALLRP